MTKGLTSWGSSSHWAPYSHRWDSPIHTLISSGNSADCTPWRTPVSPFVQLVNSRVDEQTFTGSSISEHPLKWQSHPWEACLTPCSGCKLQLCASIHSAHLQQPHQVHCSGVLGGQNPGLYRPQLRSQRAQCSTWHLGGVLEVLAGRI